MCECLLVNEQSGVSEAEICMVQVHTTYKLGLKAVDPASVVPCAEAQAELQVTWLGEDEI